MFCHFVISHHWQFFYFLNYLLKARSDLNYLIKILKWRVDKELGQAYFEECVVEVSFINAIYKPRFKKTKLLLSLDQIVY